LQGGLSSFVAGLFFFTSNPFSTEGVYASAVYNGAYLIPEYAITVTVIYLLLEKKLLNIYM
jgi:thiamine transporter ThiT